jgi:hypothetical protein
MNATEQSEPKEARHNGGQVVRVHVPIAGLAIALGLGAIIGIVTYRYGATGGKPRTAPPALIPASVITNKPAVRRVDPQLINGKMQITIILDQPVLYDAHRLDHPDRVYLDLHNARLAPELSSKTVFVNQGGLTDVRMAQTQPDAVRVVADLEKRFDYSVTQQASPAALIVELKPRKHPARKRRTADEQPKKTS